MKNTVDMNSELRRKSYTQIKALLNEGKQLWVRLGKAGTDSERVAQVVDATPAWGLAKLHVRDRHIEFIGTWELK
jgi:hypothetical protein